MAYLQNNKPSEIWYKNPTLDRPKNGNFVVLNGNTCAGKSLLLKQLSQTIIKQKDKSKNKVQILNEFVLHPPYFNLQFHFPKEWSFLVQLNFMIQRHSLLQRYLNLGFNVVSERGPWEDHLYMKYHFETGNINEEEWNTFSKLENCLSKKIANPVVYIFLDLNPNVSIDRLNEAEKKGERPKEFPSEESKKEIIINWHQRYQKHFAELKEKHSNTKTKFISWNAEQDQKQLKDNFFQQLSESNFYSPSPTGS